jgi:hypothetical protein
MPTVQVSCVVKAPPLRAYAVFADLRSAQSRLPSIKSIELLAGTDSPLSVGTRWKETRIMMGKEATETMEVAEAVPGSHYKVEARSCGCLYTTWFRFRPKDGGTEVQAEFTGQPISLGAKLMSPMFFFMKGIMRKCLQQDVDALASHVS